MLSTRDRFQTAPDLRADINKTLSNPTSVTTVKSVLKKNGLSGRIAVKKPLLRKANIQKRLQFAQKYKNWTPEQWKSVLWTDESKFEIFGGSEEYMCDAN